MPVTAVTLNADGTTNLKNAFHRWSPPESGGDPTNNVGPTYDFSGYDPTNSTFTGSVNAPISSPRRRSSRTARRPSSP